MIYNNAQYINIYKNKFVIKTICNKIFFNCNSKKFNNKMIFLKTKNIFFIKIFVSNIFQIQR